MYDVHISCLHRYTVLLLDKNDKPISMRYVDTSKQARGTANLMLAADWATSIELTHEKLGTAKAVVVNRRHRCVWEKLYSDVS